MKIAYSGTHSTGKTTDVYETGKQYKIWYPTSRIELLTEVARRNPFQLLNKNATEETQTWMFSKQIQEEIELLGYNDILICDRSLVDYVAYTYYLFPYLADKMFEFLRYHIETYDKIIFKSLDKNRWLYDDGQREGDDEEYRSEIENLMLSLHYKLLQEGKHFKLEIV